MIRPANKAGDTNGIRDIPLIDIADVDAALPAIETASRDIGFMYVVGHGISDETISDARSAVIEYFALPPEVKDRDRISREI